MTDQPGGHGQERPVLTLADLRLCFEGAVPAVIASASADGVPNITYLSRVCLVDDEHVALSNQFFSKTSRNLAENPRASLLLIDPVTYDEFRLTVVYERTERRGRVFERLSDEVDTLASLTGMTDVFKLRAADVYRVLDIEQVLTSVHRHGLVAPIGTDLAPGAPRRDEPPSLDAATLGALQVRLSRYGDLDSLETAALEALDTVLGHRHSLFLLLDETGGRLYTLATHGFDEEGIGSEVKVGKGIIGMAAARATTIRVGNLRQMDKYAHSVRRAYEGQGVVGPGFTMPVPGLPGAESRVAVPAMALGQLVGVLSIDSADQVAFTPADEAYLSVVASMLANAVEIERAQERAAEDEGADTRRGEAGAPAADDPVAPSTRVRFFSVDGSTFLDDDYLIKGVAGRILWALLRHHHDEGRLEFTNKEVRLDPSLELPEFRDNFESRLILLRRRLDERGAPIRIEKTGRGRFRLIVDTQLRLEAIDPLPS